jgi:hypothetical protein
MTTTIDDVSADAKVTAYSHVWLDKLLTIARWVNRHVNAKPHGEWREDATHSEVARKDKNFYTRAAEGTPV